MPGPTRAMVGRERELELLRDTLADVRRGRAQVVLLQGEAGIGKTRLAEALLTGATACAVAWGRAWESGGAPEYWPWIEALRALGHDEAVAELETARSGIDAGARFRMFDRVASALGRVDRPTVIVLDDLHVADEPSVRLLHFVGRTVRDAPLLLVGTHRETDRRDVGDVAHDALVVPLTALHDDAIRTLVDATPAVTERVVDAAGGNPFFASELARLWAVDEGALPATVRDAVAQRIASLPDDAVDAIRTAAVVGRAFEIPLVAEVAGVTEQTIVDRLTPAMRAGVVHQHPTQWTFQHDLVRASIVDALDPIERARRHLAVADALEQRPAVPPAVLAHHCWEATGVIDRARAAQALATAAQHADATLAYEDAARHWGRAADLTDDPRERAGRLLARGAALRLGGDFTRARRAYATASDLATTIGDAMLAAEAVLGSGMLAQASFEPETVRRHERALADLPGGDSRLRALLLSALGSHLSHSERYEDGIELSSAALAMARRLDDDHTLATTIFNHHYLLIMDSTRHGERMPLARELLQLADESGDIELRINARLWFAHDLLEAGDLDGMEHELARANALAHASRLPFGQWASTYPRAWLALARDELVDAERLAVEAHEIGASIGFVDIDAVHEAFLFHLRRAQGRLDELTSSRADDATGVVTAFVALALAEHGHREAASGMIRKAMVHTPRTLQFAGLNLLIAEAVVLVGDAETARVLYDRLLPTSGLVVSSVICGSPHGLVDRILGGLAATFGDDTAAATHLDVARRFHERVGFRRFLRDEPAPAASPVGAGRRSRVWRDGEYWTFEHGGTTSRLKDSPGVRHLARLLLDPGRELHALDLAGSPMSEGGTGAMLDDRAKSAYRTRLVELQDEIDDADAASDIGRAERARVELDALVDQLASSVGLGGRDREGSGATERARQSVTRAVKRAVERAAAADPALGAHLRATIHTGIYSTYQPDPAAPVTWAD